MFRKKEAGKLSEAVFDKKEIPMHKLSQETHMPDSLAHLHGFITTEAAEQKLLEEYTRSLDTDSSGRFPAAGDFWKDTITGITYQIVAITFDKNENAPLPAITGHNSENYSSYEERTAQYHDDFPRIVRIIARTAHGVYTAFTTRHFNSYYERFSVIEQEWEKIDRFVPTTKPVTWKWCYPYLKPVIDWFARRNMVQKIVPFSTDEALNDLAHMKDGPLWVLNVLRIHGKLADILFEATATRESQSKLVKIEATWLPQNITGMFTRLALSESTGFRSALMKGHIALITPQQARAILDTKEAKEEIARLEKWKAAIKEAGNTRIKDSI